MMIGGWGGWAIKKIPLGMDTSFEDIPTIWKQYIQGRLSFNVIKELTALITSHNSFLSSLSGLRE